MATIEDDLRTWIGALRSLTDTPDKAALFRKARTQFAVMVAQEAISTPWTDKVPVVYGVWLDAHSEPIYVGQTLDAGRRLWDLPIGESHHLANTYPPEIWSRIIIVHWQDILQEDPLLQTALIAELHALGLDDVGSTRAIGLMLEHRLQRLLRPRFNIVKRNSRVGGWRMVDHDVSRALGAMQSVSIEVLYTRVVTVWCLLAEDRSTQQTSSVRHQFGNIVYPSNIWHTRFVPEDHSEQTNT